MRLRSTCTRTMWRLGPASRTMSPGCSSQACNRAEGLNKGARKRRLFQTSCFQTEFSSHLFLCLSSGHMMVSEVAPPPRLPASSRPSAGRPDLYLPAASWSSDTKSLYALWILWLEALPLGAHGEFLEGRWIHKASRPPRALGPGHRTVNLAEAETRLWSGPTLRAGVRTPLRVEEVYRHYQTGLKY